MRGKSVGGGGGMIAVGELAIAMQIWMAAGEAVRRELVSAVRGAAGRVLLRVLGGR